MSESMASAASPGMPSVLVVDDDVDCLAEMCELIDALGFSVKGVDTVKAALVTIAEDLSIGIVLTDLRMQAMDGFDLLAEIEARFARSRPIVRLVASGFPSLEHAIEAMRHGASDFLEKPVSANQIKHCLRRAIGKWTLPRTEDTDPNGQERHLLQDGTRPTASNLATIVRRLQRQRMLRADTLNSKLFSDPAWDILLDLMAADLANQTVSVSSACAATQVPFSTGLRYVNRLVRAELAVRCNDPNDKRRDLLRISDQGRKAMTDYIEILAEKDKDLLAREHQAQRAE